MDQKQETLGLEKMEEMRKQDKKRRRERWKDEKTGSNFSGPKIGETRKKSMDKSVCLKSILFNLAAVPVPLKMYIVLETSIIQVWRSEKGKPIRNLSKDWCALWQDLSSILDKMVVEDSCWGKRLKYQTHTHTHTHMLGQAIRVANSFQNQWPKSTLTSEKR